MACAVTRGFPNHSLATPGVDNRRTAIEMLRLDASPAQNLVEETFATEGNGLLGWPLSWQPVGAPPGD